MFSETIFTHQNINLKPMLKSFDLLPIIIFYSLVEDVIKMFRHDLITILIFVLEIKRELKFNGAFFNLD